MPIVRRVDNLPELCLRDAWSTGSRRGATLPLPRWPLVRLELCNEDVRGPGLSFSANLTVHRSETIR
jgi:hypothetical protein